MVAKTLTFKFIRVFCVTSWLRISVVLTSSQHKKNSLMLSSQFTLLEILRKKKLRSHIHWQTRNSKLNRWAQFFERVPENFLFSQSDTLLKFCSFFSKRMWTSVRKVKYIVLLRQILAIMLDQNNAQFLRKRRPRKGVLWVGGFTLNAIRELSWDSNSPYGAKWVSQELLTGNIYDKQVTSKKQACWAAWSNLPRNNEAEEASFIFFSTYKNV